MVEQWQGRLPTAPGARPVWQLYYLIASSGGLCVGSGKPSPLLIVVGFWPFDFGFLDWFPRCVSCGFPTWCSLS